MFLVRGSSGIGLSQGPPSYESVSDFQRDDSRSCKLMMFSPDGRYFAWMNGLMLKIVVTETWKTAAEIKRQKISAIRFSPLGNFIATWEPFISNIILSVE